MAHHVNKYLVSKGHHVRVINHQSSDSYIYEGVEVIGATGSLDAYRWADVVCTHLDYTQYTIIMAHAAQRPLIHFVHNDIEYACIKNGVKAQHIVYNSDWIKSAIKYPWPSFVLHPPCEPAHYNVTDTPERSEYITLVSLNERKGGELFSRIARAMPERKFLGVVGSYDNPGPLKLTQPQIIANMPGNVTIVQNSPDIHSVYRRTRLLLMPSDYESWGRTATEAMCSGIPVICTPTAGLVENCGGAADYVGSVIQDAEPGAASVDQGDVQDWVQAIKRYDNSTYYGEKSLHCRQRAAELNPQRELEELEQFILNARF